KAVDARDTYTGSHSERVSQLAARIAVRLGLDVEQVELTRLAGSLHDLGKLAIPEEILRKAGELTDSERLVLQRHPEIAHRMLDSLGVDPVAEIVLHHHERWDGAGYPSGLRGEDSPLGARIIFVVDAYDAMTSDRVYRPRLSHEEAVDELRRCAGTQFDPLIVDAFVGRLELLPEDDVHRPLRPHHRHLRRRPGEVEVGPNVLRAHDVVRAAVGLAGDDRQLRHGRLRERVEELGPVTDDPAPFLRRSGQEPGDVDE